MTELRHKRFYEKRQFERLVARDIRRSRPKGDELLSLYGSKTAREIAAMFGVREWSARRWIREARQCA